MDEGASEKNPVRQETERFPEIKIDRMNLFYGASISGIKEFRIAEESTIGEGLYLTSQRETAEGYAKRRAKLNPHSKPTVYQVEISNLRMADFREKKTLDIFASKLKNRLLEEVKKPDLPYYIQGAMRQTLEKINAHSYRSGKDLMWSHPGLSTEIVKNEGFDGLLAKEGGEGDEIGDHDSYVIFDPTKAKVLKEVSVGIPHI